MNDSLSPREIVRAMVDLGAAKAAHSVPDLLIRGMLSGALLAFATSMALEGALQTNVALVGALIFPVGFAIIIILGLELVTGNFGLVPLAVLAHRTTVGRMLANWFWVFVGNMLGSLIFAGLFYVVLTDVGNVGASALGDHLRALAEAKTIAYEPYGYDGLVTAFVKAMLCNWMVCLGVVMGMSSKSTLGRIVGCWLPIFAFFALGFEHCVVNMFVIPMGMMLGAKISFADWWYWNQIPVTLGNIAGGFLFTGLPLYWTYLKGGAEDMPAPAARMSLGPAE
ncbi:formate/nitrite transporter family protein [Mesorhizobium sophorae]|uniref:formate/nitrite transporter family protein n=1 Tax=Mesorhizobium sophorae TaxID=1300294 RepID=UPI000BA3F8DD|nr:formate/nitrite transporter family protein [Mesorhizobium sophorae]